MKPRIARICYDSDIAEKPRVLKAEQRLAAALATRGMEVKAVRIPAAPNGDKQGADDFIKSKGNRAFAQLVKAARPVKETAAGGELLLVSVDDITAEDVRWLIDDLIPLGMLSALAGDMGQGKSTLALEWAAQGSRKRHAAFKTIYVTNENTHSITTKPRWEAAKGKPGYLTMLDGIRSDHGTVRGITFDDVEVLRAAIKQTGAKFIVFDPIQSFMGESVDTHMANQTRAKLDPLARFAREENVAILFISHTPKAGVGRGVNVMLGSVDVGAVMRSIMIAGSPAENSEHHVLLLVKHSVGPGIPGRDYTIEQVPGTGARTRIKWGGETHLTYADLRAPEQTRSKRKTQLESGRDWLRDALATGPQPATSLFAEWAAETGQELNNASKVLQKASNELGLVKRRPGGPHGPWVWELPPPGKYVGGSQTTARRVAK